MTMVLLMVVGLLLLLNLIALRYAADSRDGKDWQPGDWPARDNR